MADKTSLGLMGLILAGVTAGVMVVAGLVVQGHMKGRFVLDPAKAVAEMSSTRVR